MRMLFELVTGGASLARAVREPGLAGLSKKRPPTVVQLHERRAIGRVVDPRIAAYARLMLHKRRPVRLRISRTGL